ncbi:MAG: MobA/MobL family protein, partial [Waterburya sp.]
MDHSSGKIYDYSDKEVYHTEIINSNNEAFWAHERESLWNAVECANTRKNACFAKEIELALPVGLSHQTKIELTRRFVTNEIVEKYGVVADIGFHNFEGAGSHNPHCHIMFTIRSIEDEGFGKRVSELV